MHFVTSVVEVLDMVSDDNDGVPPEEPTKLGVDLGLLSSPTELTSEGVDCGSPQRLSA